LAGRGLSTSDYVELTRVAARCAEQVARGEWEEAGRMISLFLTLSDFKLPGADFYYPQIVKGVCELQAGSFEDAERTFARATLHPLRDENSFGGLGQAYFYQGRYAEALASFQKSRELRRDDRCIEFNLEAARLYADARGDAAVSGDFALAELSPGDRAKVEKLQGIALLRQGRCREAAELFSALAERKQLDNASVIYYHRALAACGRTREAISLLSREAAARGDDNIHHHLADAYLQAGMVYAALLVYEEELSRPGRPRKYVVEHARILKALGGRNRARVRELCERVLDPTNFGGGPKTAEDFYYAGFANYLLGNHARARYDYERSGELYEYYDRFD
jgi:tetratricopeptide (TPR) repeat protein